MGGLKSVAERLCTGSLVLIRRPGAWVMAGEALEDRGWRAFVVLGGGAWGGAAVYTERDLMWLVAAGWCALAVRAGKPTEEPADEDPDEPAVGPGVPELVAAMHDLADPHVHLSALARELGWGEDTDRVRQLLETAEVPVTRGVRMGGKVSTGVKAEHFPPLPPADADTPVGVVVPGQASNSNSNTGLVVERGEGITIIREPAETAHRHTQLRSR